MDGAKALRENKARLLLIAGCPPRVIKERVAISSPRLSGLTRKLGLPKWKRGRVLGSCAPKTLHRLTIITDGLRRGCTKTSLAREIGISQQRVHQILHPNKQRCRSAAFRAMKSGSLIRVDICEICRTKEKTEAHHSDYNKPLKVTWLCKSCHRRLDLGGRKKEPK